MCILDVSTDSSAGLASFTGFAVLSNPEYLPSSPVVDLIAQIFLGSESASTLYGSLRYFNGGEDRIVFSQGRPMLFFIEATFAQVPSVGSNLPYEVTDCDFVGDQISPSIHCRLPCWGPFPMSIMKILNYDRNAGTFTLNLNVSVSSHQKAKDATKRPLRPVVPAHCVALDVLKGTPGLSMPDSAHQRFAFVRGRLYDVTFRSNNRHLGIERFHVVAEEIVFLGQPAIVVKAS